MVYRNIVYVVYIFRRGLLCLVYCVYIHTIMESGLSRGPGVEVERVVPEVWYSSWMLGGRSGEVVAELKSKRRGRRGTEVP